MFCPNCGAQIPDNSRSCLYCGAPLQSTANPAQPANPVQNTRPAQNEYQEKSGSKVVMIAIIIAAAVVTMCVLGIVAMFLLLPRASQAEIPNTIAAEQIEMPTEATEAPTTEPTAPANPLSAANPYRDMYDPEVGTVLAESNSRYYVRSELEQYSADYLCLARNEIFARYGYSFSDRHLAEYFENMPWYNEDVSVNSSITGKFNKYEKANVALLNYIQDRKEGKQGTPGGSIYLKYYNPDSEYIIPESNQMLLEGYHLQGMDKDQLCAARNEIFARRGYTFSDKDLFIYFSYCSWYVPTVEAGRTDLLGMTTTERKNVEFIRSYEKGERLDLNNLNRTLNYTVSCDEFSITLPAYWKSAAKVNKYNDGDSHRFRFSEKNSDNAGLGGKLFTLLVIPAEEIGGYADGYCATVGLLTSPEGKQFYLLSSHPTDVQYITDDDYVCTIYDIMYNDIDRILGTVKGANGYTFQYYK